MQNFCRKQSASCIAYMPANRQTHMLNLYINKNTHDEWSCVFADGRLIARQYLRFHQYGLKNFLIPLHSLI